MEISEVRIAVLVSHPIQYYSPVFRELARHVDLTVMYAHEATDVDQKRAGFDVAFRWDTDILSGYKYVFLGNMAKSPSLNNFWGVSTPDIRQKLNERAYDAVLVMGWHLKAYVQGIVAAKQLGIPLIVRGDSHLNTPRSMLKRIIKSLFYPLFLRLFDAVLYVGKRSREYYLHYHYPVDKMYFSPHCVDTNWFSASCKNVEQKKLREKMGVKNNTKLVLFAGKLQPYKRPIDVIDACSVLRSSNIDVEVLVAGSGSMEEELIDKANALGLPIHMLGFCNQSKMPEVYAVADVLVLPSDGRETWGLVVNEALACGVPVVVSDAVGSSEDMVSGAGTGRVYPLADISALAKAIKCVLEIEKKSPEINMKSEEYSVNTAVRGILQSIESLVTDK